MASIADHGKTTPCRIPRVVQYKYGWQSQGVVADPSCMYTSIASIVEWKYKVSTQSSTWSKTLAVLQIGITAHYQCEVTYIQLVTLRQNCTHLALLY